MTVASVSSAILSVTAAAALRLTPAPTLSEITLTCSDGVQMAAQVWSTNRSNMSKSDNNNNNNITANTNTSKDLRRILCLHGWMDNCRSFYNFAPNLLNALQHVEPNELELVALDLPGHGLSSHKSMDGPSVVLAEAAFYVAEAVQQLQWNQPQASSSFILIGHSMGAAISCLYAASFPEQVSKLVLLEGAGPLPRNPKDVAKHVRQHVQRRQAALSKYNDSNNGNGNSKPTPRIYPSMEKAVETRCQTARNFPGDQTLSHEAAYEMVQRGTKSVPAFVNGTQNNAQQQAQGIQFIHDPRLQWPSLQFFTVEQTEALYEDIACPTALLLAERGWPFDPDRHRIMLNLLQPVVHLTLPGSHHFHADPDTAPAVVAAVADFLMEPIVS